MLQDHSLQVRKTCNTCEKMSYISLCILLYFCLGGLFHTLEVQNKAKIAQTNNTTKKWGCSILKNVRYMRYVAVTAAQHWLECLSPNA